MNYNKSKVVAHVINEDSVPIIDSSIAIIKHKDNNIIKSQIISSPMCGGKDITTDDVETRIEELLYRCLNFTSKLMGVDELTGVHYKDKSLMLYVIDGVGSINRHHCAGNVFYHPNNTHMLKWLDLMFWNEYLVFPNHNLVGKINIKRSNGDIDSEAFIPKDTRNDLRPGESIRWSKSNENFIIRVKVDEGEMEKHVTITDICKYNPNINLTINIYKREYYKDSPKWVLKLYDSWLTSLYKMRINLGRKITLKITVFQSFNIGNEGMIIGDAGSPESGVPVIGWEENTPKDSQNSMDKERTNHNGIKVGDIILAINEKPCNGFNLNDTLKALLSDSSEVNIVLEDKKINIKLI